MNKSARRHPKDDIASTTRINRRSVSVGILSFAATSATLNGTRAAKADGELAIPLLGLLPGLPAIVTLAVGVARTVGSILLDNTLSELQSRVINLNQSADAIYGALSKIGVKVEELVDGNHFERTSVQARSELFDFAMALSNAEAFLDHRRINDKITATEKIIIRLERHGPRTFSDICCLFAMQNILRKMLGTPRNIIERENRNYSKIIANWVDGIGSDSISVLSANSHQFSTFGRKIIDRSFFDLPVATAYDIVDNRVRSIEYDIHIHTSHGTGNHKLEVVKNVELSEQVSVRDFGGLTKLVIGGIGSSGGLLDRDFEHTEVLLEREVAIARADAFLSATRMQVIEKIEKYLSNPQAFDETSEKYAELLKAAEMVRDTLNG